MRTATATRRELSVRLSSRESPPPVHRPRPSARSAGRARAALDQSALVVGQAHPGPVRGHRPGAVEAGRMRSGGAARAGQPEAAGRTGRRRVVRAAARRTGRRSGRLPDPAAVVPAAGSKQGAESAQRHRVLLDGVRRRRGAAELLRRPGHPGRRPPEVRLGPGPAADRGRAATTAPGTSASR